MAVTPTSFKVRFPEFAAVDDSRIQIFIDEAELDVGPAWGTLIDRGILYLTAHYLTLNERQSTSGYASGTVGVVTSKSIGDVSKSYGTIKQDDLEDSYLAQTSYGLFYASMLTRVGMGAVAVT